MMSSRVIATTRNTVSCLRIVLILSSLIFILKGRTVLCSTPHPDGDEQDEEVYIVPPRPEDAPYPLLLHERDVIHYVDANKEFLEIGSGSYANVTLGELRDSGLPVIIKKFRSTTFYDIFHEARVHRYIEPLGFSPLLIGILPTGPMARNVSLVYEYIDHSRDLMSWLDDDDPFTPLQWLQICHEVAVNLHQLHQQGVLFNDLHRKNVLVQKMDNRLRTYIIDFGLSTYRTGQLYKHDEKSLEGYNYLAPELVNYTYTTEAADVYALGYIFLKITNLFPAPAVKSLADWCMSLDPRDRPELPEVISRIERAYVDLSPLPCGAGREGEEESAPCQDLIRFHYVSRDVNGTASLVNPQIQRAVDRGGIITALRSASPKLSNVNDYINCHTSVPVMNSKDFVEGATEEITVAGDHSDTAIRLAVMNDLNRTVVVKDFYDVHFEVIREETCVTMYLADRGVAPKVIGITIEYRSLRDIAFVQEFFGRGVTLWAFVSKTRMYEWDLNKMKKVSEKSLQSLVSPGMPRPEMCLVNLKDVFLAILKYTVQPTCRAKSFRQRILENVSIQLVSHLQTAHDSGMLINNFRMENTIVKWNSTDEEPSAETVDTAIEIRLVDLGSVTSLKKGLQFDPEPLIENKYVYLAPEVVLGHRSSKASDIYSACVAVRSLFLNYFSISDVALEFQRYLTSTHRYRDKDETASYCSRDGSSCKHTLADEQWTRSKKYLIPSVITPYSKLQQLLLTCLHSSHELRPKAKEFIEVLKEVSKSNFDWVWL